jgi:hypothetical protein
MGDFHSSFDESDLVNSLNIWGETTVDAEDLSFDNSADAQVVKNFSAILPGVGITVLSDSFVIEAVNSGNLPSFVVASEEGDVSGVLELEAKKKLEGLD